MAAEDGPKATPALPIYRVHVAFNSENVWANLQKPCRKDPMATLLQQDFDFDKTEYWKPLFAKGKEEELVRLPTEAIGRSALERSFASTQPPTPSGRPGTPGGARRPSLSAGSLVGGYMLEDPSQALVYTAAEEQHAAQIERSLEDQLEQRMIDHRSMGRHSGVQHRTNLNSAIAHSLAEVLGDLEQFSSCCRQTGNEAPFPMRSNADLPVTRKDLDDKMRRVESEFRGPDHRGRYVYGIPINQPYMDFEHVWEAVNESRILELGDDYAEYAIKVRVFPYACKVLSVWVFIACAVEG